MTASPTNLFAFYDGWDRYQGLLVGVLAPLTAEQLAWRPAPHLRSVGENATHIIGARARWCHELMGLGDDAYAALGRWDHRDAPTRSAAELVQGLEQSWQVLHTALLGWTPDDLDFAYPNVRPDPGEHASFTRQWVIWHLIEHDLHHGGEISMTIGMHGIPGIDL